MANHKSALKRTRQNEVRRLRNKITKTRVKNTIKDVRKAVSENQAEAAAKTFNVAQSVIDKAARKGVIHKNNAARKISRLSKLLETLNG